MLDNAWPEGVGVLEIAIAELSVFVLPPAMDFAVVVDGARVKGARRKAQGGRQTTDGCWLQAIYRAAVAELAVAIETPAVRNARW